MAKAKSLKHMSGLDTAAKWQTLRTSLDDAQTDHDAMEILARCLSVDAVVPAWIAFFDLVEKLAPERKTPSAAADQFLEAVPAQTNPALFVKALRTFRLVEDATRYLSLVERLEEVGNLQAVHLDEIALALCSIPFLRVLQKEGFLTKALEVAIKASPPDAIVPVLRKALARVQAGPLHHRAQVNALWADGLREKSDHALPRKYHTYYRLMVGAIGPEDREALVSLVGDISPFILNNAVGGEPKRIAQLVYALVAEKDIAGVVQELSPSVITLFEKWRMYCSDSGLHLLCELWREREWPKHSESGQVCETGAVGMLAIFYAQWGLQTIPNCLRSAVDRNGLGDSLTPLIQAPFVARNRAIHVAFCISGQLRGFRKVVPGLLEKLTQNCQASVFVDTWADIGGNELRPAQAWRRFDGKFLSAFNAAVNALGADEIAHRYPTLLGAPAGQNICLEELATVFGCPVENVRIEDDTASEFQGWSSSDKMHYKIERCFDLWRDLSGEADLVFRLRPDKELLSVLPYFDWPQLLETGTRANVLYSDFGYRGDFSYGLSMGDQAALSTPIIASRYARAYRLMKKMAKLGWANVPNNVVGHSTLSHGLFLGGVSVETLPIRWGGFVNAEEKMEPAEIRRSILADLSGRHPDQWDNSLLDAIAE